MCDCCRVSGCPALQGGGAKVHGFLKCGVHEESGGAGPRIHLGASPRDHLSHPNNDQEFQELGWGDDSLLASV